MNDEKILRGVPKIHYGAFGGVTPFPICLKAVSDYLGDELSYVDAIVQSGGAFRLVWNVQKWDGGNVDIVYAYDNPETPFRQGIAALGRDVDMLWRTADTTKEDFKAFIRKTIDKGRPVISLGPIGPPEAGIITGYRNGGDTLLGWSMFQQWEWEVFDEEGYFISDSWWDAQDFQGVMAFGDVVGPRFDAKRIMENAVAALEGRREGCHAKGVAAYGPWKEAILGAVEGDFDMDIAGMNAIMMCQGDATDCLIDGRGNAAEYFMRLAKDNPGQPLYGEIAARFEDIVKTIRGDIYRALGGYQRGPDQEKALKQPETRRLIAESIDAMKTSDEKALALMKQLLAAGVDKQTR